MQNDSTVAPARANPQQMTSSTPAVIEPEIDHAARNALLKIAGLACDAQNLIDIWASPHVEDYQRDAAVSSARGLATLIGAIATAVTCDPPMPVSVSVWLLGGQA
jgi:20S proteasome alpha/beta subunit